MLFKKCKKSFQFWEKEKEYKCGLSWVYRYYREWEVDRKWKYEGVGPLLKEMGGGNKSIIKKRESAWVDVYEQLEYVLPKEEDIVEKKFEWTFCRYAWESREPTVPLRPLPQQGTYDPSLSREPTDSASLPPL